MLRLRFAEFILSEAERLIMTAASASFLVMLSVAKHLLPEKPALRNVSYLNDAAQKFSALQPG